MLTLGEQLILLALDTRKGTLRNSWMLRFGLNATALAELEDRGLITVWQPDGAAAVTPVPGAEGPTGDPVLEKLWDRVVQATEGDLRPHPDECIRSWLDPSLDFYVRTLKERGVIDWDKPLHTDARYGRLRLQDPEATAPARAAVERVRTSAQPDQRDQDLAAIASWLGLAAVVYPRLRDRGKRTELAEAVATQRFVQLLDRVLPEATAARGHAPGSPDVFPDGLPTSDPSSPGHHGGHHSGSDGGGGGHHSGFDGGSVGHF